MLGFVGHLTVLSNPTLTCLVNSSPAALYTQYLNAQLVGFS